MANTVHLNITTLDNVFFEGDVRSVSLKTKSGGSIVLQPGRTPFFSSIAICQLSINSPSDSDYRVCSISEGLVYADSTNIRIITEDILDREQLDIDVLNRDLTNIKAEIQRTSNAREQSILEVKLKRVINRIQVYNNN